MAASNIINPYEQIWKTRDLRALNAPVAIDNKLPEWRRGLGAFGKEMQATGYGLVGLGAQGVENLIGENAVTSGLVDWGVEGYNKAIQESQSGLNAPSVARVEDIKNASDAMDWAGYQLGKGIPMLGSLALSGGIGGAVARIGANQGVKALAKSAVGDLVKKTVTTKAIQAAEGQVVTQAMKQAAATALRDTFAKGAIAGGFAGSFGLEGGLAFGEQVGEGVNPADAVKSAIAVGGINGALEFLPFYSAAKSIGMGSYAKKSIAKVIADNPELSKRAIGLAKEIGGRAAKGAAVGAGAEGITEGLQELVSIASLRWAENEPLFADLTPEDWGRIKNAAAAGALVGGVAMGAGATVGGPQTQETAPPPAGIPTVTPPAPADQTRTQVLEAMRGKIDTDLAAAQAGGDIKKVEELQQIKELYDRQLGVRTPVQEMQEQVLPIQEVPVETPPVETPPIIQTVPPTQEAVPPVRETPLDIPPVPPVTEQAPVTQLTPPTTQPLVPPRPGETVQLKRGEEIILTPPGQAETRVVPTEEEKANLQQLLGERPTEKPVNQTQPEVIPNAEEVQTQTEAQVSRTIKPFTSKDVGKIITFTPDDKNSNIGYAESGKPYHIVSIGKNGKNIQIEDDNGAKTIINYSDLIGHSRVTNGNPFVVSENPATAPLTDIGPVKNGLITMELRADYNQGKSDEELANGPLSELKRAGGITPAHVAKARAELGMPPNPGSPNTRFSMPRRQPNAIEATMEEFETVRKQFQERQAQETPFKNWFGKGTPGVTADSAGTPITLYHGTNNPTFNQWDSSRAGEASKHPTSGLGFFMTADKGAAARYGNNLMALHAKIQNPYELTDADLTSIETKEDAAKLRRKLMGKGYDGAVVKAPGAKPYVIAFDSKQVKFVTNEKPTDSEDFRYSFAGPRAATADLMGLETAEKRVEKGDNPDVVRQQTGWHKGADGKWRFEISDNEMEWKQSFDSIPESELFKDEKAIPLSKVIDHPKLFAAYPFLEAIKLIKRKALFDVGQRTQGYFNDDKLEIIVTPYAKDPLSTVLHEIQHAIQMYEGFAKGGNESSVWEALPVETKENIAKGAMEKLNEKVAKEKEKLDAATLLERHPDLVMDYNDAVVKRDKAFTVFQDYEKRPFDEPKRQQKSKIWMDEIENVERTGKLISKLFGEENTPLSSLSFAKYDTVISFIRFLKHNDSDYKKEITKYKFKLNVEITDLLEKIAAIRSGDEKAIRAEANLYEFYKKLAGETEARLTQARQSMTEEERKERSPQSMQEYPDEEQIVVMQGGQSLSAEQGSPIRPVTPDELRANVNSVMGENWIQQAEAAGIIEVIDGAGTRGESGSWDGNKFRLYTQTMPAGGSPLGVLLHEGSHAPTFNEILGDSLEGYLKDLDTLAENGNQTARNAIAQATIAVADVLGIKHNLMQGGNKTDLKNMQALIEERKPGLLAEEKLAYFIQYAAETKDGAGFLKRLINAIKTWFAQTKIGQALKQAGLGFELNEAMAVEWAKASLINSLAEAQQAARARELVIAEAKQMPPSVRLGRALETQYSYAGPQAATANNVSLQQAKQRVDNNEDAETVRKETGWFKGKDNKWRFEIDDRDLSFNTEWIEQQRKERISDPQQVANDFAEFDLGSWESDTQWSQGEKETRNLDEGDFIDKFETTVGQLVNHPKLFEAYPRLRNIDINFIVNTMATYDPKGFYSPSNNEIEIKAYTYDNAKKILIHELQHAVQEIEGFAAGGSPDNLNYLKLAGEIEARDTARRLDMTAEQRQANPPYKETMFRDGIANEDIILSQSGDVYYSMGLQEFKDTLWTDPTDSRQDFVNKPGLLQKFRANFIDFFAEMEKKSTRVYNAYSLLRNKKAARLVQARQEYMFPLRDLIAKGPWTSKEVGDMLAARHLKVDNVNTRLAERSSYSYTKELLKALPDSKKKELMKARSNVKAGKMPDGSVYLDTNGTPAKMSKRTKQKLMFDLMNKYVVFEQLNPDGKQVLRFEWEVFKDAAGGFSNGGVGKGIVRSIDDVLAGTSKDQTRFDKIANLFDAMNRHALQIREDGELITPEEHARLLLDKTAYAPLRRESYNVDREIEQLFQRAGQGGSKQLGVRTGTTALSEPTLVLQNALAALEASAAAAERNLANKELYEVVNADKEGWKPWFAIVDADKYMTHDEDGFLQERNATASNRADITLINKGKKLVIRPNMHNERAMGFVRAANNLDAQIVSGPMSVLNFFNNIVRWVNVTASPAFLMMNAIRDPGTALYNLQATEAAPYTNEIFANYGKSFKALKKVFLDGNRDPTDADVKMVEAFENAGGRTSFIEQLNPSDDTWRSFDAQVARRQGNMKQIMAAKDKWIDGLENFNVLFENVMRLSTFNVLMDKGVNKTRAARIAQDLTTNFTRRGYKTQALGNWWVFFNAAVQGNYQVLRNMLASKKLQAWAGGTIMFALMLDLLGRAVADDWDEIPEWDKERFIILPVKVAGDFVKIPAPWVYNVLWRAGGMFGETLAGVRKPQNMVLDLAALTAVTFNPLGKPGSIAQAISPTAADPFVQILENKDFAGNPIGPEGFPGAGNKANSELLWSSTPKGYQSVARFVNELTGGSAVESGAIDLRPGDYQLLAKFLTGSLGRFLSDATFGLQDNLDKGIEGPKEIPIVKEFFSEPYNPMRSQTYHTNIAAVYGAHKLEKMYREGPERDLIKLQEVRQARSKDLRMYSQAQDVERQIKSLRVRIRAAENRKDNARVKDLRGRMEEVQERFNAAYKQRVG